MQNLSYTLATAANGTTLTTTDGLLPTLYRDNPQDQQALLLRLGKQITEAVAAENAAQQEQAQPVAIAVGTKKTDYPFMIQGQLAPGHNWGLQFYTEHDTYNETNAVYLNDTFTYGLEVTPATVKHLSQPGSYLKSVAFTGTWHITTCNGMFQGCSSLQSLDLSSFDTAAATSFQQMFFGCFSLRTLIGTHTLAEVEAGEVVALKNMGKAFTSAQTVNLYLPGLLTRKDILAIVNGLYDMNKNERTHTSTLQIGTTYKALLTDQEIAAANAKGWTIS